jgi:undecaprenyl diphosphate synthase
MKKYMISLRWIWSKEWMTPRLISVLEDAQKRLTFDSERTVCLWINYGGHDEILRGISKRYDAWAQKDELSSDVFGKYLDLFGLPAVDLVIRTKAHMANRISWYLLRWIGYAELYFTDVLFPDFWITELQKALTRFEEVKEYRNFGK